ncbi:hypothetical protein YIM73052_12000 [Thermus antranikianii]
MPYIEELLEVLQGLGLSDDWQPAETIESGGGTIPKTSSKGIVRSQSNDIIELGPFARIMAQYAMRDRAALRAASVLGSYALSLAKGAQDGVSALRERAIQTGRVYIPRKYVVSGLQVTTGTWRSLSIAEGEAVHGGFRRYYAARPNGIGVPPNYGTTTINYILYLDNSGEPFLSEGTTAPEGALPLARVTVPAGDTGADFGGTITDLRTVIQPSTWTLPPATATVALSAPMPSTAYAVFLHVEGASDPGRVELMVANKTRNAFVIEHRGEADDVVIRWMAVDMSVV